MEGHVSSHVFRAQKLKFIVHYKSSGLRYCIANKGSSLERRSGPFVQSYTVVNTFYSKCDDIDQLISLDLFNKILGHRKGQAEDHSLINYEIGTNICRPII